MVRNLEKRPVKRQGPIFPAGAAFAGANRGFFDDYFLEKGGSPRGAFWEVLFHSPSPNLGKAPKKKASRRHPQSATKKEKKNYSGIRGNGGGSTKTGFPAKTAVHDHNWFWKKKGLSMELGGGGPPPPPLEVPEFWVLIWGALERQVGFWKGGPESGGTD